MSFSAELKRFADKSIENLILVIRKIALDLFARIVLKTPVRTGRARMNWHVSIGFVRDELKELEREYSESEAYTESVKVAMREIQGYSDAELTIFILNNLPYIEVLENGSSMQAPEGMVKVTLEEYPGIVQDAVRGVP